MKTKKDSRPLMVTRVADIRGPGAKTLYAHGYAELAAVLGTEPILVAEVIHMGKLEPLNISELVLARRYGVVISTGEERPYDALDALVDLAKAMRPTTISEVCVAVPPKVEAPRGLETLWAYTYSDVASQLGVSQSSLWAHARGPSAALDMTSLRSIVDFIETRHALTK